MLRSRWRKIKGDLSINKLRTFFVIVAIFIGIFGLSVVANSYAILLREMDKNYLETTPASATLKTDPLSVEIIRKVIDLPMIKDAEKRDTVMGRVQVGENEWKDVRLFTIDDFSGVRLDTFRPEQGKTAPDTGEILFERKALTVANAKVGQALNIRIPGGVNTELELVGTVHAPGLAPAWMEGYAYGYITPETFRMLGSPLKTSELKILIDGDVMNSAQIRQSTYELKDFLEKEGIRVYGVEIPRPGKHPHYDQMATLLFLTQTFGLLALALSGILVANMITALLEQQNRQIGIMKAIGASTPQIVGMYEMMVLVFALTAMAFSLPAGVYAGSKYAWFAAQMLNFNIYSYDIPLTTFLLEGAVGLLVPLLSAFFPILKGSRVTVREALQNYGISQERYGGKTPDKLFVTFRLLSRPFLLSLRNTFRRKGRLIFTILVMAAGGTGFIVAMNIFASMYNTVDEKVNSIPYDIQATFDQAFPVEEIERILQEIPGVVKAEAWGGAGTFRVRDNGDYGNSFNLIAPPASGDLMKEPALYEGRWLDAHNKSEIVVNQRLLSCEPDIKVGKDITLRINSKDTHWQVVGISKELMGFPAAYVYNEALTVIDGNKDDARNAVILTKEHDGLFQAKVAKLLEQKMTEEMMPISSLIKIADYRTALENHLLVIATFLVLMSLLVVGVGGLGLMTTISINTMERTKEMGMMRAMGATSPLLMGLVVTEGIIIGLLSWVLSAVLSLPLSQYVSYTFGMLFFEAPLEFAASVPGLLIWLFIVILFAALASFYPSRKACRLPIREALSYE